MQDIHTHGALCIHCPKVFRLYDCIIVIGIQAVTRRITLRCKHGSDVGIQKVVYLKLMCN